MTRTFISPENSKNLAPFGILNTLCSNGSRLLGMNMEEKWLDEVLVILETVLLEKSVLEEPINAKRRAEKILILLKCEIVIYFLNIERCFNLDRLTFG